MMNYMFKPTSKFQMLVDPGLSTLSAMKPPEVYRINKTLVVDCLARGNIKL
jgi:hypothetical protein